MQTGNEDLAAQLLEIFALEADERLQAMNHNLLALERPVDPAEREELLKAIFRDAHSLKGAAGMVDLEEISSIAHRLESFFGRLQRGETEPDATAFDLVYRALDAIGSLVRQGTAGEAADVNTAGLLVELEALAADRRSPDRPLMGRPAPPSRTKKIERAAKPGARKQARTKKAPTVQPEAVPPPSTGTAESHQGSRPKGTPAQTSEHARTTEETIRVATAKLDSLMAQVGELLAARVGAEHRLSELRELAGSVEQWETMWRKLRPQFSWLSVDDDHEAAHSGNGNGSATHGSNPSTGWTAPRPGGAARSQTHGGSSKERGAVLAFLDQGERRLHDMRQQLGDLYRSLEADGRRLAQATGSLHEDVRRTRMLPVSTVFDAFPRMVRDLAREHGKQVDLVVTGGDTEVDRSVLEQIRAPLTHLLRNAIDHGLETPDQRIESGKPAEGTIRLTASQIGSTILIEVADDGVGIDPGALRARAVEAGIVNAERAAALSDREAVWLIFRSGFSTRQEVTELSGRGVGMDVVRVTVERLQGMVDVESRAGQGVTFSLTLPLTVATTRCLLVRAAGQTLGLPTTNVIRMVGLGPDDIRRAGGQDVVVVDEGTVPLVHLTDVVQLEPDSQPIGTAENQKRSAIILGTSDRRVAFVVDSLLGDQEVVVKGLPAPLYRVRHIAGSAILGTGEVVLILGAADLVRSASRGSIGEMVARLDDAERSDRPRASIVVADDSFTTRTLEKNILEAAGYVVHAASDGLEAWVLLQREGGDLLISDVQMPGMDGIELTAKVRQDQKLKDLPVILVTSLDSVEDRQRGIDAGADAYVVKSAFEQVQLLETIQRLI
jgi:two-component system, chemotaxis family, sensor kinase CheA